MKAILIYLLGIASGVLIIGVMLNSLDKNPKPTGPPVPNYKVREFYPNAGNLEFIHLSNEYNVGDTIQPDFEDKFYLRRRYTIIEHLKQ